MILALGTLKLFKDLKENNLLDDFRLDFDQLGEIDNKTIYYSPIEANSQDDKNMEKMISEYKWEVNKKYHVKTTLSIIT